MLDLMGWPTDEMTHLLRTWLWATSRPMPLSCASRTWQASHGTM